jgi:electron transfer flavoprotein beta subunit
MKILVCIKQVHDPETIFRVDESTGSVKPEGHVKYWMNHADEFAVEEAILIKEAHPGTIVDALTVGPDRAARVLERAVGMGADNGVHLLVTGEGYISPLTIASWIASYAFDREYDLILAGVMAEDHMNGQVGPLLAELLSLPCATSVIFEDLRAKGGMVHVEREIEGGLRDVLELALPALLTVQTGINKPRYPSLSNLLRAKEQKAFVIDLETLPSVEEREEVLSSHYPGKSRIGMVLEGDQWKKASQLLQLFEKKAFI